MSIEVVEGDAAQENVVGLPANVLLYGGPGVGKTTDAVTAFTKDGRCSAFVIPCEDGALKPIAARRLPVPGHVKTTVKSWPQLVEAFGWLLQNRGRYSAVILDGLTALTNNLYREAGEQFKGNKNKFEIPNFVRNCLFLIREWSRYIGMHSVFVAHVLPPAVVDGVFYPGSPLLQPKSMINDYYGLIDTILRVDYVAMPGQNPMRVYYTGGNDWPSKLTMAQPPDWRQWRAKNREGCASAIVPADLGAFLRARQPPYHGL